MSQFPIWNQLLLAEFFSPAASGEEVWLQASRSELDSIGLELGGAEGLVDAVRQGVPWLDDTTGASCAELAVRLVRQRKSRLRSPGYVDPGEMDPGYEGKKAPAYLPILALWVLASSEAETGFYAKVAGLTGRPCESTRRNDMLEAWTDLEAWSVHECSGEFGCFKPRVVGGHRFVGIPRSQCLVSRKDVRGLSQLFQQAGLRPKEAVTPSLVGRLADLASDAHYLSAGLRSAFPNPVYREPLAQILGSVLQEWDGRRRGPERSRMREGSQGNGPQPSDDVDIMTLVLSPSSTVADAWDLQWRFQASGQGNRCWMVVGKSRIPAHLESWGGCLRTEADEASSALSRDILATSGTKEVEHEITYGDEDAPELGGGVRRVLVERRPLRILAWDSPDPRLGEALVERGLPIFGPAYILCSPSNRHNFARYLKNEGIVHEAMHPAGLPSGWTLTCIPQAERLATGQRRYLHEGDEDLVRPEARIRLVGGRLILGTGARRYAWYDLPVVEVEAPASACVSGTHLALEELGSKASNGSRTNVRYFKIAEIDSSRFAFDVSVADMGRELASTKLRIAPPDGMLRGQAREFSIDSLGRRRADGLGLRGASLGRDWTPLDPPHRTDPLPCEELSGQGRSAEAFPGDSIAGKFLDSLAQLGSIGYGPARDQLDRLAADAGIVLQPALVLLELRSRGHLEIEIDGKGHMVRVHAVEPTLYRLPATHGGIPLFGICGSLRTGHWSTLIADPHCISFLECREGSYLPALRLAILDDTVADVAGIDMVLERQPPCDAVSRWAASLDQVMALMATGASSFSADIRQLQRLHPNSAQFVVAQTGTLDVDPETRCRLYRLDHPNITGLQAYMLAALVGEEGRRTYSFIHDSRWGVWMAQTAFARMLRDKHRMEDVYPWPIHYDDQARSLWLPARMRPPAVLERALALCAGTGPRLFSIQAGDDGALVIEKSGALLGKVSDVYSEFAPATWLCYEWVPREVADRVALALRGRIVPFASGPGPTMGCKDDQCAGRIGQ